ncbi:MAG TPA: DMT family protein [Polyangiaceae bacterium]|nr:DMT family protein [Polyangiaceae bacterium]
MRTILLLLGSNLFMTTAWYGHLRFREVALWKVVLVSWGIAFFEYCLQVPANRLGYGEFTAFQLKIIQEVITLLVFVGFSLLWLGERLRWNYGVAFALILAAVYFAFLPGTSPG